MGLLRLLRLGGKAKRKEHGAKSKDGDFSLHIFLCCRHSTLDTRPLIAHLVSSVTYHAERRDLSDIEVLARREIDSSFERRPEFVRWRMPFNPTLLDQQKKRRPDVDRPLCCEIDFI